MGIFDSGESEDEVQISPNEEGSSNNGKLKSEVESKVVSGGSEKNNGQSDETDISGVASGSQVSNKKSSKNIGVEDVYRQNERIIELLEDIAEDSKNDDDGSESQDFSGGVDGVL